MTTLEWLIAILVLLLVAALIIYVATSLMEVEGGEAAELALELLD